MEPRSRSPTTMEEAGLDALGMQRADADFEEMERRAANLGGNTTIHEKTTIDARGHEKTTITYNKGDLSPVRTTYRESNDLGKLQCNLLKEQISNLAGELTTMRQDISSLRLADSQREVQSAELARHIRESQSQVRTEMQEYAVQIQDVSTYVEINVTKSMSQATRATDALQGLRDLLTHEVSLMQNRVVKNTQVTEENATHIQGLKLQMVVANQGTDDLARRCAGEMEGLGERHLLLTVELEALKDNLKIGLCGFEENMQSALTAANVEMRTQINDLSTQSTQIASIETIVSRLAEAEKSMGASLCELQNTMDALTGSHKHHANKASELEAVCCSMKDLMAQTNNEREKAHGGLSTRVQELDQQMDLRLKNELAKLHGEHSRKHEEVKQHLLGVMGENRSGADEVHAEIRLAIEQERTMRDKAHGGLTDRLSSFDALLNDRFGQSSQENLTRHSDLQELVNNIASKEQASREELSTNHRELISNMSEQERAAREEFASQHIGHVQDLSLKFHRDLADHQASADEAHGRLQEMLTGAHESLLDTLGERHEDLERRFMDNFGQHDQKYSTNHMELKSHIAEGLAQEQAARAEFILAHRAELAGHGKTMDSFQQTHLKKLGSVEEKFLFEMERFSGDHSAKHGELKTSHASLQSQVESLEQKRALAMKAMMADHSQSFEEMLSKHSELGDYVKRIHGEQNAKHGEVHAKVLDQISGVDQRTRELVQQYTLEHDTKVGGLQGNLTSIDRKLREQFDGHAREQNSRHLEAKEQFTKFEYDYSNKLTEMGVNRASSPFQNSDESLSTARVQDLENRLRREIAASQNYDSVYELMKKERTDRDGHHATLLTRVEESDRKAKEAHQLLRQSQDEHHAAFQGHLSKQERKLRDEFTNLQDTTNSELKESYVRDRQVQTGMHERIAGLEQAQQERRALQSVQATLVDRMVDVERGQQMFDNARSALAERVANVEMLKQTSSASGLSALIDRLTDLENFVQDRQTRDRDSVTFANRFAELESKLMEQLSRASIRDNNVAEVQDMVAQFSAKDQGQIARMQNMVANEQEIRGSQLGSFAKQIDFEKTARESHQESLRAYLANEKMERETKEQSNVTREEVEVMMKRLWSEIRGHTHDIQTMQPPATRQPTTARSPSPMPSGRQQQQFMQTIGVSPQTTQLSTLGASQLSTIGASPQTVVMQGQSLPTVVMQPIVQQAQPTTSRTNYFSMGVGAEKEGSYVANPVQTLAPTAMPTSGGFLFDTISTAPTLTGRTMRSTTPPPRMGMAQETITVKSRPGSFEEMGSYVTNPVQTSYGGYEVSTGGVSSARNATVRAISPMGLAQDFSTNVVTAPQRYQVFETAAPSTMIVQGASFQTQVLKPSSDMSL